MEKNTLGKEYARIVSKNLNHYIEEKNTDRYELADYLGVGYSTLSNWILGYNAPKMDMIQKMAEFFNIKIRDLIELPNTEKVRYNKVDLVKMPVIGTIPAGTPVEAIQYIDEDDYLYIPKERLRGGKENYFLLRIKGNSMLPKYIDGDVILFYINPMPDNGAEVAVMVNGDDATFKQIFIREDGITLHPYNSLYDDAHYSPEEVRDLPLRVLGVAKSLEYRLLS